MGLRHGLSQDLAIRPSGAAHVGHSALNQMFPPFVLIPKVPCPDEWQEHHTQQFSALGDSAPSEPEAGDMLLTVGLSPSLKTATREKFPGRVGGSVG